MAQSPFPPPVVGFICKIADIGHLNSEDNVIDASRGYYLEDKNLTASRR